MSHSNIVEWPHFSASQLKTFATCKKKWAWAYVFGERPPATKPL